MAEFTSLNGYDVKDKKAVRVYDNVEAMKEDYSIRVGQTVQTLGYYESNDGGSAVYIITSVESQIDYQEVLSNGLYATLLINDYVTPEMFGAYGDEQHDDTLAIQNCFNKGKQIELKNNYLVTQALIVYSNQIIAGNNFKITNSESVNILRLDNVKDITIKNLKIEGDNTSGATQIGIACRKCTNIKITDVTVEKTGGDGVYFSECSECIVTDGILKDNLISCFAYNSEKIIFENIYSYKPRFQYGVQFKSCNNSNMRNILVDTPKDIGIFINKGNEDDANDTANITVDNVKVINEGQDGTLTTAIRSGIVVANGNNFIINNAIVENSLYDGIDIRSNNTIVNNCIIKNNSGIGIYITDGNIVKIINCDIENNTFSGITSSIDDITISNCYFKDNSDNSSRGNLTLSTSNKINIENNTFIMSSNSSTYNNIRNTGTITNSRIINNIFINEKTGTSYPDYRGSYDYASGIFANNGLTRLHSIRGTNTINCYATILNNNVTIHGYRTSIPTYTGFSDGDVFTNQSGSTCMGWVCKSDTWYPFGEIITQ